MKSFVNWKEQKHKKSNTSSICNKNFKTNECEIQTTNKQKTHHQKMVSILDIANLQTKITNQIQKARENDFHQKNPHEQTLQEKYINCINQEDELKNESSKSSAERFFNCFWAILGPLMLLVLILSFFATIHHLNTGTHLHSLFTPFFK